MRQFFEAWQPYFSSPQENGSNQKTIATATNLKMEISFTHHMEILHKTKDVAERLFYIRECALGHRSKYMLRSRLFDRLSGYGRAGFGKSDYQPYSQFYSVPWFRFLLCREPAQNRSGWRRIFRRPVVFPTGFESSGCH